MNENIDTYEHFVGIAQFNELNKLLRMDTRRDVVKELDYYGRKKSLQHDGFTVTAVMQSESAEFRFVASTQRLLLAIMEEYSKCSRQEIRMTIDSYMERCGLANRAETRKQLKIDLQSLSAIHFDIADKGAIVYKNCSLFEIAELRHPGVIYIKLSEEVRASFKDKLGLVQLPRLYYTLDRKRYQAAPALLYYISLMRHISNKTNLHKDMLRIESLLAVTILPSVEEVRRTANGGIRERIIERFFRELHALDSELTFSYTRNGKSISEKAVKNLRYEDFIDICVHISWKYERIFRTGKSVADDG